MSQLNRSSEKDFNCLILDPFLSRIKLFPSKIKLSFAPIWFTYISGTWRYWAAELETLDLSSNFLKVYGEADKFTKISTFFFFKSIMGFFLWIPLPSISLLTHKSSHIVKPIRQVLLLISFFNTETFSSDLKYLFSSNTSSVGRIILRAIIFHSPPSTNAIEL